MRQSITLNIWLESDEIWQCWYSWMCSKEGVLTVILLGVGPVLACGDGTQITHREAIQERCIQSSAPAVIPHKVVRSDPTTTVVSQRGQSAKKRRSFPR
jgi:hypothetical protein